MEFEKMFDTLELLKLPNRNIFVFFSKEPEGFEYNGKYYEKQIIKGYLPERPAEAGPYYVFIVHKDENINNEFVFGDKGFLAQSHYDITDKMASELTINYMKALRTIIDYEDSVNIVPGKKSD